MFDDNRYFDVFIEYAKAAPDDILMQITAHNRGPETAPLARAAAALVPQYLVAGAWRRQAARCRPPATTSIAREHVSWASTRSISRRPELLFCDNETNAASCSASRPARAISRMPSTNTSSHGERDAVNPEQTGTKAAAALSYVEPGAAERQLRLRLTPRDDRAPFGEFDASSRRAAKKRTSSIRTCKQRIADAERASCSGRHLPGMIWSKQFYYYDIPQWLNGDPASRRRPPAAPARPQSRLDAPQQRRRDLDARQVGISLVRRLGSGVSLRYRWR